MKRIILIAAIGLCCGASAWLTHAIDQVRVSRIQAELQNERRISAAMRHSAEHHIRILDLIGYWTRDDEPMWTIVREQEAELAIR